MTNTLSSIHLIHFFFLFWKFKIKLINPDKTNTTIIRTYDKNKSHSTTIYFCLIYAKLISFFCFLFLFFSDHIHLNI